MIDYLGDGLLLWMQLALTAAAVVLAAFAAFVIARSGVLLAQFVREYRRQPARDRSKWLEERIFWLHLSRRRGGRREKED